MFENLQKELSYDQSLYSGKMLDQEVIVYNVEGAHTEKPSARRIYDYVKRTLGSGETMSN